MKSGAFHSKGKFLLSGEYLVLHGAKALAVPLKFGQRMLVSELPESGILKWETYVLEELWFTASFLIEDLQILTSSNEKTALFIQDLLKEGGKLQPGFYTTTHGLHIQNHIDFDINWGLGSSSSLISNLAYWLEINPYDLYRSKFGGSGYDVYCARATGAIMYQLNGACPMVHPSPYHPSFKENLYFVYLGRKKDTQESVREFNEIPFKDEKVIREVSDLTDSMLQASALEDFLQLIRLHEEMISGVLNLLPVKKKLFPDFPGEIKSLGAWGGDFVMAGTRMAPDEVKDYFSKRNMPIVFRWDEIVY